MFIILFCVPICSALAIELPKGVPLTLLSAYQFGKPFTCLDGSQTIPWAHVNDDYCDCRDGSDEPGTNACPNGVFYCRDIEYKLVSLSTAFVNDGYCDCCDGSDEYLQNTVCQSTCSVLAAAAREAKSVKRAQLERGHEIYKKYVADLPARLEEKRIAEEKAAAERKAQAELDALTSTTEQTTTAAMSTTAFNQQDESVEIAADKVPSDEPKESGVDGSKENQAEQSELHHDAVDGDEVYDAAEDAAEDGEPEDDKTEVSEQHHSEPPPEPDYGPNKGFYMLKDLEGDKPCLTFNDQKYTYDLCPFDHVYQHDGHRKISLGMWSSWVFADDDQAHENPYAIMLYDRGESCWQGPSRSTKVHVHCGEETKILATGEPSRCEYVMHLITPAACFESPDVLFERLHRDL